MERRAFLKMAGTCTALVSCAPSILMAGERAGSGYFHLQKQQGRWRLLSPSGSPFFSLGLNHVDPAVLMHADGAGPWYRIYGNSMERWLNAVGREIRAWGFNTMGWNQEVVARGRTIHRHSRAFTYEEYQWLQMPYCHMLPFAQLHHWDTDHRHVDFFSYEFEDWCDYVARTHCGRFVDDPKLIGYFYSDCPAWVHNQRKNAWKGPVFDPEGLKTPEGRERLRQIARRYYQVCYESVRRYDPHHLILGDRYEANRPYALEVIESALPYINVLSFQHFDTPQAIVENLNLFAERTGMPILLADSGVADGRTWHTGTLALDAERYGKTLQKVVEEAPSCVGFHLCGAFLRNGVRKYGLLSPTEERSPAFAEMVSVNQRVLEHF